MDRIGPYFIEALPLEFAGYDEAPLIRLRDLVLRTGRPAGRGDLRSRLWPGKLAVSASAVEGQTRLMIVDGSGMAVGDDIAMIFFDADGADYAMLDRRIPAALIRELLDSDPSS